MDGVVLEQQQNIENVMKIGCNIERMVTIIRFWQTV